MTFFNIQGIDMKFLVLMPVVLLMACAAPKQSQAWYKSGATANDTTTANAKCDYESSAATQSINTAYRSMFGQEMERAMRKAELHKQCMTAQGYRQ